MQHETSSFYISMQPNYYVIVEMHVDIIILHADICNSHDKYYIKINTMWRSEKLSLNVSRLSNITIIRM